jgi:hypothetical protein
MTEIEQARAELVRESRVYSRRRDVNPYVALLDEVKWRAGHVASLRAKLAFMVEDELFVIDHNGNLVDSALVRRYDKERTLLDRACKLAIDAGVAERYVQLAELQGGALFRVLEQAFGDPLVALTDEQRQQLGPALERAFQAYQLQLESGSS